jgi:hypothetical protein
MRGIEPAIEVDDASDEGVHRDHNVEGAGKAA